MNTHRRLSRAIAVAITLSMPRPVLAQSDAPVGSDLPNNVTLEQALELLRTRSPASQAAQAQVDVAVAQRVRAGVYPNPSLSYGGLALANGANTGAAWQHQIVVEQPVSIFGQIGVRQDVADLNIRAERGRATADLTERSLLVRQAFVALLAEQERVRVLEEGLGDLEGIATIVRGRHEAGDRSIYDVARLELEVAALQVELRNAQTGVADASGRLAVVLGFPGWQPRASGVLSPSDVVIDAARLWESAQAQRPSIQAARAQVSAARGGVNLARRERLPMPALALGAMLTQNQDSQSVFFGLSLPLPVFDRGQGDIARANAEVDARNRQLDVEMAQTHAELMRARTVYVEQRQTLRFVEIEMTERIPTIRRMAEASYHGGSSGILELLDALRSIRAIRIAQLEQQQAVKLAEATLVTVAGLETVELPGRSER